MKTFEYDTHECTEPELFDTLNNKGKDGWEFILPISIQRIVPPKFIGQQPQIQNTIKLIFKREKNG